MIKFITENFVELSIHFCIFFIGMKFWEFFFERFIPGFADEEKPTKTESIIDNIITIIFAMAAAIITIKSR